MSAPRRVASLPVAALALAGLLACHGAEPTSPVAFEPVAASFGLVDVNSTSPSSGEVVTPRRYLGRVSAWYFGHAT